MKPTTIVSLLLVTLLAAPLVSADSVYAYRNVSTFVSPALDLFDALAVRYGVFEGGNGVTVEADVLELVLFFNNLYFAGWRGEAYKSKANYTDFAAAALAFLIRHEAIVEYNETNGISGFQPPPNGDQVLSAYQLWARLWQVSVTPTPVTFSDGSTGNLWDISFTTDDDVFSYNVQYAGRPYLVNGVNVTSDKLKFGWELFYYNYTSAVNAPGAQLALIAIVGITAGAQSNYNAPNSTSPSAGVNVLSSGYIGYLNIENQADTWNLQALYAKASVSASYVTNYTNFLPGESAVVGWEVAAVILSYLRPNAYTIIHDPELGAVVPDTPSAPISTTSGISPGSSTGSSPGSSTGSPPGSSTGSSSSTPGSTTGSKSSGASSLAASLALFVAGLVSVFFL